MYLILGTRINRTKLLDWVSHNNLGSCLKEFNENEIFRKRLEVYNPSNLVHISKDKTLQCTCYGKCWILPNSIGFIIDDYEESYLYIFIGKEFNVDDINTTKFQIRINDLKIFAKTIDNDYDINNHISFHRIKQKQTGHSTKSLIDEFVKYENKTMNFLKCLIILKVVSSLIFSILIYLFIIKFKDANYINININEFISNLWLQYQHQYIEKEYILLQGDDC